MSIRPILILTTLFAAGLSLAVQAQPVMGLYIAGAGGVNAKESSAPSSGNFCSLEFTSVGCDRLSTISGAAGTTTVGVRPSYNIGFGVVGSVGWGFGNGLRAELEGNYRGNGVSRVGINGLGSAPTGGTMHTYGFMANLLYDINIGQSWIFPYAAAGIGYARTSLDNIHPLDGSGTGGSGAYGNFAYQAMLGAAFPIAGVPGLSLTAEYRFMGTAGGASASVRLNDRICAISVNGCPAVRFSLGDQYNHAGLFGLRYAFGVAPAPIR